MSVIVSSLPLPPIPGLPREVNRLIPKLQQDIIGGNPADVKIIFQELNDNSSIYIRQVLSHKFEKLQSTIGDYAVKNDLVEICRLVKDFGGSFSSEAYGIAFKKGGLIFSLLEPKLEGILLEVGYCSICDENAAVYLLDCKHYFCYQCTSSWVKESFPSLQINCPQKDCTALVTIQQLKQLLSAEYYEVHLNNLLHHHVSTIENFLRCPTCVNGYEFSDPDSCFTMDCSHCKAKSCTRCGCLEHLEISCEEAMKDKDNSTMKFHNTKQCPSCNIPIQKSEGCSHMTCKICKYEFCWVCLGKYIPGRRSFNDLCPCDGTNMDDFDLFG